MAKLDEKGWWIKKNGESVHPERVKIEDKLKDEMIDSILGKAAGVTEVIKKFKEDAYDEVDSYFELLLDKYGVETKKGVKGFTLENFSGTAKIQVATADNIIFDEKLQIAKKKIDEYLHEITQDSNPDIQQLISKAFEVDKKGEVNPRKILALRSYDITHPKWLEAMAIIAESVEIVASKQYIRFYTRENQRENYKQVSLDIAGV
ncbi:DUF3164 family protein [Halarcobacter sp.]|uniref:DUF3164 family protein n=1 Tax=Halarcobacter sp. TaxID=2321133 RepID=UPI0029F45CD0|nr:DUF3164 family protein [Halarcobacter sp.]